MMLMIAARGFRGFHVIYDSAILAVSDSKKVSQEGELFEKITNRSKQRGKERAVFCIFPIIALQNHSLDRLSVGVTTPRRWTKSCP
jgi:hypothetical protein